MLPLSYTNFLNAFEPISELSTLFHLYAHLFMCQYQTGLMIEVLWYKSNLNPPVLWCFPRYP